MSRLFSILTFFLIINFWPDYECFSGILTFGRIMEVFASSQSPKRCGGWHAQLLHIRRPRRGAAVWNPFAGPFTNPDGLFLQPLTVPQLGRDLSTLRVLIFVLFQNRLNFAPALLNLAHPRLTWPNLASTWSQFLNLWGQDGSQSIPRCFPRPILNQFIIDFCFLIDFSLIFG